MREERAWSSAFRLVLALRESAELKKKARLKPELHALFLRSFFPLTR
jgi:hypothetical protein